MVLSYGQIVFRFVKINAFDRRTDRQTVFSSLDRVCIPRSAVKMSSNIAETAHDI